MTIKQAREAGGRELSVHLNPRGAAALAFLQRNTGWPIQDIVAGALVSMALRTGFDPWGDGDDRSSADRR